MTLEFRLAELDDIPALAMLVQSAYRGEESRQGWTTEADLLDGQRTDPAELAEVITKPGSCLLLAEVDGEVVGCCQLESLEGRTAHLGMFSVRPQLQGRGVGRSIVGQAERMARDLWSAEQMHMTVLRPRSDLVAWYERLGYRRTGEIVPFPYHDERVGVPKVPDLEFVVLAKTL